MGNDMHFNEAGVKTAENRQGLIAKHNLDVMRNNLAPNDLKLNNADESHLPTESSMGGGMIQRDSYKVNNTE